MTEQSLLSDELLEQLIAVGQVDVLVGVPTLNNAQTIGGVVRAVHRAFNRYFPKVRTVLINSDGGSTDGTRALVRDYASDDSDTFVVTHSLRTMHRISTPYHGVPGKGTALRQILTAADLTQARAVAVLDPEVANVAPEWIAALLTPVLGQGCDFVSPVYPRHPLDGPLITQVVRPLVREAYGRQVREPLAAEFGCSGTFAAHCLDQPVWETDLARFGIDLWVTAAALKADFRVCQAPFGPRVVVPSPDKPGFPDVFQQVVGALFDCLEVDAPYWLPRTQFEPVPVIGTIGDGAPAVPHVDGRRLAETFCADIQSLQSVLEPILSPGTFSRLQGIADRDCTALQYPDDLWVATVNEFLTAYHHGVMRRDHVTRALMPLYLGRTGSFLLRHAEAPAPAAESSLETLCGLFERSKARLVERWNHNDRGDEWLR